jgi:hypothetical protein
MSWYDPKDASDTIPEGWYSAVIESVKNAVSKNSGRDQQVVQYRVYGPREMVLSDYYQAATLWKYKQLAKALGQEAEFVAGTFDAKDFLRKSIDVELVIEDSAQYGEQNRIKGFAPDGEQAGAKPSFSASRPSSTKGETIDHDDIPF